MPYDYLLDRNLRQVNVVMNPSFALPDVAHVFDRMEADRSWGYAGLFDGRALDWTPSTADVRAIVDRIARTSAQLAIKPGPAAFVAGSVVTFGMGRMLALLGESAVGLNMRVFKDVAEAERWLDEQRAPDRP